MTVLLHNDHRLSRVIAYVMLVVASLATFTSVNVALGMSIAVQIIAVFMIAGALIGLYGYLSKENHIEILGYPLLIMSMGALGVSVFMGSVGQQPRMVLGTLLLAFTANLVARYRDLQALIRFANEVNKETKK